MRYKKSRIETPFEGDDVKALLKTSNCENFGRYFSEKVKKNAVFAMFFLFSVTKHSLETRFGFPKYQKYTRYPLDFKLNVTLARPLRLAFFLFF